MHYEKERENDLGTNDYISSDLDADMKNSWGTDPVIFNAEDKEFNFDLDAAASDKNHLVSEYLTKEDDALIVNWSEIELEYKGSGVFVKTVWINPPYGKGYIMFTQELWDSFDAHYLMGGMGDDTSELIAELYVRGFEPKEIIFCDTGSEFPHTYEYIEHLQKWCKEKKWSKVVTLKKTDKFNDPLSVISLCESQKTLPAAAFGSKSCSLRFKTETADLYFNNNPDCWEAWGVKKKGVANKKHTGKILRMVGINFDEPTRTHNWSPQNKWVQVYPLFDWEVGEKESEAVEEIGLYYPGKSSCTICPNMTHGEIAMLRDDYPVIFKQSLGIEAEYRNTSLVESAQDDLFGDDSFDNTVLGLGGRSGKTWDQMLQEYDANPQHYKQSTNKKPCGCGH